MKLSALALLLTACTLDRSGIEESDAGSFDGGLDGGRFDAGRDGGPRDAAFDADFDAGNADGGFDAAIDGGADGGLDGGIGDGGFDASFDADFDSGMLDPCPAVGTQVCMDDSVATCTPGGWVIDPACPLGCTATAGTARCRRVDVTNVMNDILLVSGTSPIAVATGRIVTVDTDSGAITRDDGVVIRAAGAAGDASGILFRIEAQGGAYPELAIFAASAITIRSGATLRAVGTRALVLLSSGNAAIEGVLDVSAVGTTAGSGGGDGGTSRTAGGDPGGGEPGTLADIGDGHQGAGGGGGHAAAGGEGGSDDFLFVIAVGGAGGAAIADVDGSPLVGGGGGGAGADAGSGGDGGGGGGAVQITSNRQIRVLGVIRAHGAGGAQGDRSGGGGGAGGTIVLEAPEITVSADAILAANGGGGGGSDTDAGLAENGDDGSDGTARANGGGGNGLGAGAGGRGGADTTLAGEDGGDGTAGGGGGGSIGRIRFVSDAAVVLLGAASPSAAPAQTSGAITSL
jgi:hypothetical protein